MLLALRKALAHELLDAFAQDVAFKFRTARGEGCCARLRHDQEYDIAGEGAKQEDRKDGEQGLHGLSRLRKIP